jgi:hypothetical protein
MKPSLLFTRYAALYLLAGAAHANGPVLTTPGTASWTSEATATGTRTVFTLTGNTVLTWDQLNLANGSEMVFDFTGGSTVVNFLEGTGTHRIDGSVTSNGNVAFFSPRAGLEVNGSIIAKGVTLATLNADAAAFSEGNYEMSGLAGFKSLRINGHVEATDGDVVLGGERIAISDTAKIKASQDALIAAGRNVSVSATGDRRLKENSGVGFVLHMGETGASRIEVAAGREINNQGTLNAGQGRIFLAVGGDGQITNESGGVIVGDLEFDGAFDSQGTVLVPDEGDAVPAVNESTLTIPSLTRPDGTSVGVTLPQGADAGNAEQDVPTSSPAGSAGLGNLAGNGGRKDSSQTVSAPRMITYTVPMSASGDAQRDAGARTRVADKRVAAAGKSKALLSRSSFFGLRGGNTPLIAKR